MAARPFYLMAKPPPALALYIAALFGSAGGRPPDLLHVTLLPLGDRIGIGPHLLAHIVAILDGLALASFRVMFDRLCGDAIFRPSEPLRGAIAGQRALATSFARHGLRTTPLYDFRPHMTLAYRPVGAGEVAIDPIGWQVEDIRLIESIVGEARHVEHGRWMLRR